MKVWAIAALLDKVLNKQRLIKSERRTDTVAAERVRSK